MHGRAGRGPGLRAGASRAFASMFALALVFLLPLILAPAAPAFAHDVGGVGATNFRTTLSGLTPPVAGLNLRVIENGSRLELRNATDGEVVIAGYRGEPYARVGPGGVFVNERSPATYVNASRFSTAPVPPDADPELPAVWRQVADQPVWRWHDHRVHWMLSTLPPAVAAEPTRPHRISMWTIGLEYEGRSVTATGSLDWVPGPSPWPWFALLSLTAAGVAVTALLRRPHRLLSAATAALLAAEVVHGLGAMLATGGTLPERLDALLGPDALLVWPVMILTAWLLWRRHTRAAWLAAAAGFIATTTVALDDAPVWWRSSAPSALPVVANRTAVALVVGLGAGLVLALPLLLRRHRPQPWPAATGVAAAPAAAPEGPAGERPAPAHADAGRDAGSEGTIAAGVGRRGVVGYLFAGALGAMVGAAAGGSVATSRTAGTPRIPQQPGGAGTVPFYGDRQAGIATPPKPQASGWVAGFDLVEGVDLAALRGLLRRWSDAGARLTSGQPLGHTDDTVIAGADPGGLAITIGFGPSLFGKAGVPATARPEALAPLPAFAGERLDPRRSDGDLGVVIAGDDSIVVAHAARVFQRLARGVAELRWQMRGFNSARGSGSGTSSPRNLMGQVDGTNNPRPADSDFATRIYAAEPAWLRGGSFLVVRRIRMLLDEWDRLAVDAQEQVIGRRKDTGAPLSGGDERTPPDFGARGLGGELAIPPSAHIRLAAPAFNEGAAMLRRSFSYLDGDEAGLLFLAWQADPRSGFIPVQRRLAGADALGRFIRHETSALFAMPRGAVRGGYVGQSLLEG